MAKKSFSISQSIAEGLTNSIKTVSNHKGELNYEMMSIKLVEPDPENPRKLNLSFEELQNGMLNEERLPEEKRKQFDALKPLIDSIKKVGVRNAVEVYKSHNKYRLISGERRWLASLAAQREYIPVHICDKPSNFDLRYLQWIENMQREDLSLWEKYQNLKQIVEAHIANSEQHKEITVEELSHILGTSQRQSYRYLSLIKAEPDILAAVQMGKINNLKLLEEITKFKDITDRKELIANLDNLNPKKVLHQVKDAKTTSYKNKIHNQGRPAKKINLGYIENLLTAKAIFNMLLTHDELMQFKHHFNDIDWASAKNATNAFKKMFALIEKHVVESV